MMSTEMVEGGYWLLICTIFVIVANVSQIVAPPSFHPAALGNAAFCPRLLTNKPSFDNIYHTRASHL